MTNTLALCCLLVGLSAADDCFGIPDWILPGILSVETKSRYASDGSIIFVDRRRGRAGELGCAQITRRAFDAVAKPGESFSRLETDSAFCEALAARYLISLKKRYGSWVNAIQAYNAGRPCPAGRRYLNRIYIVMGMN